MYSRFQFEDDRGKSVGKWHPFGFLMRGTFFAALFTYPSYQDIILSGTINIIVFEIGINIIALHKNIFYAGQTSQMDKVLGNWKWLICAVFLAGGIITKIWL